MYQQIIRRGWYHIPSLILIATGLYTGVGRLLWYLEYIENPPSHRIGFLTELILLGFLLFSSFLILVGVYGFCLDRPVLPLAVLVGVISLRGTFAIELYSMSLGTQLALAIGITATILPAVATYLFFTYTGHLSG